MRDRDTELDRGRSVRPHRLRRPVGLAATLLATLLAPATAPAQVCEPWEVVPGPDAPGAERTYLRDVHAVADDEVWAVGESFGDGQIRTFSLRWDGAAWEPVPMPVPDDDFGDFGAWAVDGAGGSVWAGGHREFTPAGIPNAFFGSHNAVWRLVDGAWELQETPVLGGGSGDFVWAVHAVSAEEAWFVGDGHPVAGGAQPALAMRWNGSSFELHDVPLVNPETGNRSGNPLEAVDGTAPDDVWAVGGTDVNAVGGPGYSQIHHWDGTGWTHVPGPTPGFFNQLFAVAAVAPDDVWAAGEYWDADGIFPLLLHWDGTEWSQVEAPGGFLDMAVAGPDDIWASGYAIFHWDGTGWSLAQTFPELPYRSLSGISALGPCELWAVGLWNVDQEFHTLTARVSGAETPSPMLFLEGFEGGRPVGW